LQTITTAPDLREEWMGKGEEIGRFKEGEEKGRWDCGRGTVGC
jgi:hypothetical protein